MSNIHPCFIRWPLIKKIFKKIFGVLLFVAKKICVGATHTYGVCQGPGGGYFPKRKQSLAYKPYTKLTRTLHETYSSKAYKPYVKLTPNLRETYSCMHIQYCVLMDCEYIQY